MLLTHVNSLSLVSMINKVVNISMNFHNNLKWHPFGCSGALGKLIHGKNLNSKISCQTPISGLLC
jgi:hypothetical protein